MTDEFFMLSMRQLGQEVDLITNRDQYCGAVWSDMQFRFSSWDEHKAYHAGSLPRKRFVELCSANNKRRLDAGRQPKGDSHS